MQIFVVCFTDVVAVKFRREISNSAKIRKTDSNSQKHFSSGSALTFIFQCQASEKAVFFNSLLFAAELPDICISKQGEGAYTRQALYCGMPISFAFEVLYSRRKISEVQVPMYRIWPKLPGPVYCLAVQEVNVCSFHTLSKPFKASAFVLLLQQVRTISES